LLEIRGYYARVNGRIGVIETEEFIDLGSEKTLPGDRLKLFDAAAPGLCRKRQHRIHA
jgi:hypothetical protein